jgi:PKD repeat protein
MLLKYSVLRIVIVALIVCANNFSAFGKTVKSNLKCTVNASDSSIDVKNQSTKSLTSYSINFGDGTIVTDNTCIDYHHKYATPGTFNVCLTVSDGVTTDIACEQVVIAGTVVKPLKNIKSKFKSTISDTDSTIQITNQSTGTATSYIMDFGDGTKNIGTQLIDYQHKYVNVGTYNVCLVISDGTFADTACEQVVIKGVAVKPVKNIKSKFKSTISDTDSSIYITNQSTGAATSYKIDFGDGISNTGNQFIDYQHKYKNAGTYNVCLIISDGTFADTACDQVVIKGEIISYSAKFKSSVSEIDSTVSITNQSSKKSGYYKINFGDGTIIVDTGYKDYIHKYAKTGTFDVCLTTTNNPANENSENTYCEQVTIPEPSKCYADFKYEISGLTIKLINTSRGNISKLLWDMGEGTRKINKDSFYFTYSGPGVYNVMLLVSNIKQNCESYIEKSIVIRGDTSNCIASFKYSFITSNKVQFNNTSVGSYEKVQWKFGDGSTSDELNPTYEFTNPGVYTVTLVVKSRRNAIKTTFTEKISIEESKIELLSDFDAITYPDSINAEFNSKALGSSISQFIWSFGDGSIGMGSNVVHQYTKPGDYAACLTVVNTSGQVASLCKPINVGEAFSIVPQIGFIINDILSVNFFNYQSVKPDSVRWIFGDGNSSVDSMPTHIYNSKGIYLVNLKAWFKNGRAADKQLILNLTDNPKKLIGRFVADKSYLTNKQKADSRKVRYKGSLSGDVSRLRFDWSFGDGTTDSLNLETEHIYETDGTYEACFSVYNEVSGDSDQYCEQIIVGNPVGIEAMDHKSHLEMETSIIDNWIYVKIGSNNSSRTNTALYDISGKVLFVVSENSNSFKLRTPSEKGIYIIRCQSSDGVCSKKILIN